MYIFILEGVGRRGALKKARRRRKGPRRDRKRDLRRERKRGLRRDRRREKREVLRVPSIEEGLRQKPRQNVVVLEWGARWSATLDNFGVIV